MKMNSTDFNLRLATIDDIELVLDFIKELAEYEHMADQVVATRELLNDTIFIQKKAEVVIAEYEGSPVGFALFFHNYSTFLGRPGIYLEDLYVREAMRGMGFGTRILSYLAQLANERGCGRLEWACLDWNEPSIQFYKQMGGVPMDQWTVYRLQGEALHSMADRCLE
ncbi:MAG: N-acetyltransferase [Herbinix sp.]|jgi:GNAT superfamily N-acetyltransferase|nr:N-acetyltransferase [Herbinix sp.]